ncbi:hypothetical protein HK103_001429 [Boothiomyces macroporosus]|uniref:Uncharacterized protein n=1 Tax=Boothiomyces macroporosus TaxID=261099 RepID=A0AAD5UAD9_9FUNG|nr:hypothetical protein HK103_001429 [Boothiomyces macroporosus]
MEEKKREIHQLSNDFYTVGCDFGTNFEFDLEFGSRQHKRSRPDYGLTNNDIYQEKLAVEREMDPFRTLPPISPLQPQGFNRSGSPIAFLPKSPEVEYTGIPAIAPNELYPHRVFDRPDSHTSSSSSTVTGDDQDVASLNSRIMKLADLIYTQEESAFDSNPVSPKKGIVDADRLPDVPSPNVPPVPQSCSEEGDASSDESDNLVPQEFLEWKVDIVAFYSDPQTYLTRAYHLDLRTLGPGSYTFGGGLTCKKKVVVSELGSPSCPDLIGTIYSTGKSGTKTLVLAKGMKNAGMEYELKAGATIHLDEILRLRVDEDEEMFLHDLSREFYKNVYHPKPDLFLPYNFDLIFVGEFISDTQFMIDYFGRDMVFRASVTHIKQIFYTDPIAYRQRTYPYRVVELKPHVESGKYILNFNFAFPIHLRKRSKAPINCIVHKIEAGLNPYYF